MITYTVYESPNPPADRLDRAEGLQFVREGFSLTATAITPVWMISKRLWLGLLSYIAILAIVQACVWSLGLSEQVLAYTLTALHLIIGFEADTLRRWTLERTGWRPLGSVNGRNFEDCERRFLDNWLPGQPFVRSSSLSQSQLATQAEPVAFGGKAPVAPRTGGWRSAFGLSS